MFWPFKKRNPQSSEPVLVFKDNQSFFTYQCAYGDTEIVPKKGIVAIVENSGSLFGDVKSPSKVGADGIQTVTLKVASLRGGFFVLSQTASGNGPALVPGDLVIWVPVEFNKDLAAHSDNIMTGWIGFVVVKISPQLPFEIIGKFS